jgi:hypothetical protein
MILAEPMIFLNTISEHKDTYTSALLVTRLEKKQPPRVSENQLI